MKIHKFIGNGSLHNDLRLTEKHLIIKVMKHICQISDTFLIFFLLFIFFNIPMCKNKTEGLISNTIISLYFLMVKLT